MNYTGAVDWCNDIDVLTFENSDGWRYEVRIKNHSIYDERPYRNSQVYVSKNDALMEGKLKARELCGKPNL